MRKLILVLPIAAVLIAVGVLFGGIGGSFVFADIGTDAVAASSTVDVDTATAPPTDPAWLEMHNTVKPPKSPHVPNPPPRPPNK